jgi:hypothetical protein
MILGFVVAILPYVGIPYDVTKWMWTGIGLMIMFLLFFSQRGKLHYIPYDLEEDEPQIKKESPREISVTHDVREERPEVHVEKTVVVETLATPFEQKTTTEEVKVTTVKKRKQKMAEFLMGKEVTETEGS